MKGNWENVYSRWEWKSDGPDRRIAIVCIRKDEWSVTTSGIINFFDTKEEAMRWANAEVRMENDEIYRLSKLGFKQVGVSLHSGSGGRYLAPNSRSRTWEAFSWSGSLLHEGWCSLAEMADALEAIDQQTKKEESE